MGFRKKLPVGTFAPMKVEVEACRKLQNVELQDVYISPFIITVMKLKWQNTCYARSRENRRTNIFSRNVTGKDHVGHLDIIGRITMDLERVRSKGRIGLIWIMIVNSVRLL
jgi:hypothetical protein